jgi:hypothetical protein
MPRARISWLTIGAKLCRGRLKGMRVGRSSWAAVVVLATTAALRWRRVVAQRRWTDDTFYMSDISGDTSPPERPLLKRLRGSLVA